MSASGMYQVVLRAQIESGAAAVVTNTTALSESSVLLVADLSWEVGQKVAFQLSFPGLLEPRSFSGCVLDVRPSDGSGAESLVELGFEFRGEEERRYVADVVARVRESGVFRAAPVHVSDAEYRVLLVEDNALIREMFAYGVDKHFRKKAASVRVDFAEDTEAAWEMFRATRYDLAIVDYFLPLSSGADLIARMRRDPDLHGVPVIGISVGGDSAKEACLGAGADLFLHKPIVLRDLLTTLARLTGSVSVPPVAAG